MNRAQRIANKRAKRAGTQADEPEWMAHETPHQRAEREGTEARRRLRAERVGREYVPIWVEHPEVTPVYADDGRCVSWRPSEREQAAHRAEVEAVTEIRALDWIDTNGLIWNDLALNGLVGASADETLVICLRGVQAGEFPPDTIRDEFTAKSEALHPLHRLDERGSIVTDPWKLIND